MRGWPVAALLILLVLMGPVARAQAPAWQTAVAASGNYSVANATAADANGNVYIVGFFFSTATFGSITLTSAGQQDVFIAKWSSISSTFRA